MNHFLEETVMQPAMQGVRRARRSGHILGRCAAVLAAAALVALVAGCALPGSAERTLSIYDLGPAPQAAAIGDARLTIALTEVVAPAWLESQHMYYRLAYADVQQPRPYAQARWVTAPAQLVGQRARLRLAQFANVLASGDTAQEMTLKLELDEFSQVFDAADSSRGIVQLRASLIAGGRLLAQRSFAMQRPASSASAAGGVRALGSATDALLDELAAWVDARTRAATSR